MRYHEAIATAPPGSDRFEAADLGRLDRSALHLLFTPGPATPPLSDVAAALAGQPEIVGRIAEALPPEDGETLRRLAQGRRSPQEQRAAARRLVRGTFWHLTYNLRPELWDRLSRSEPLAPELIRDVERDLISPGIRILEVGAGSGRLTTLLEPRAGALVAIEPSAALRCLLRQRLPSVYVVAGHGHRLPVAPAWADLVIACGTFGPDPPMGGPVVLGEMLRCARPGGTVALVGAEQPRWWRDQGFELVTYPRPHAQLDAELLEFFGPARPPRHLLWRRA
jgi:SAM-dependent methyltransferase